MIMVFCADCLNPWNAASANRGRCCRGAKNKQECRVCAALLPKLLIDFVLSLVEPPQARPLSLLKVNPSEQAVLLVIDSGREEQE
jgi:hypothetical protein